jgi:RNA polymerase sigma-70 factor (ECF subfamily)
MDQTLVTRARDGDHGAFTTLVADAIDRMYATAGLILRSDDRAQEAVQEALVQAWLGIRALRDPDRWEAWLRRLLINACYGVARRDRTRRLIEIHVSTGGAGPTMQDAQGSLADRDQLERGFRLLSSEQRAVLVAHYYLDLSDADAAEALSIPVGTLKSRLHRAMSALRAVVEAEERRSPHPAEVV